MAKTYLEQEEMEDIRELTFDQRLELLVDAEVDSQRILLNRRFYRTGDYFSRSAPAIRSLSTISKYAIHRYDTINTHD